jgi:hypothetical protein
VYSLDVCDYGLISKHLHSFAYCRFDDGHVHCFTCGALNALTPLHTAVQSVGNQTKLIVILCKAVLCIAQH